MSFVCIVGGLLAFSLAAVLAGGPGRSLLIRHHRHGRLLRRGLVAVYGLLGAGLVLHGLLVPAHGFSAEIALSLLLVALVGTVALLLLTRIQPVQAPVRRRLLAIAAHPDDLELACGGTLATMVDRGHEVHAVIMTQGAQGGNAGERPAEARAGATFIGMKSVEVHDLPDTQLELTSTEMIKRIEAAIGRIDPHVIFTHSAHDQHQDHHAVHLATLRAARAHHSVLCYESPSVTREFNPGIFVDVADYTDVKVEAVLTHRDQAGKSYMTPDVVKGITSFRGRQAKREHAEGFEAVRLLATETGVL